MSLPIGRASFCDVIRAALLLATPIGEPLKNRSPYANFDIPRFELGSRDTRAATNDRLIDLRRNANYRLQLLAVLAANSRFFKKSATRNRINNTNK